MIGDSHNRMYKIRTDCNDETFSNNFDIAVSHFFNFCLLKVQYYTCILYNISVLIKKKNRTFKFQQDWFNFFQQNNWSDLFPLRILVSRCFVQYSACPTKKAKCHKIGDFQKMCKGLAMKSSTSTMFLITAAHIYCFSAYYFCLIQWFKSFIHRGYRRRNFCFVVTC